MWPLYAGNPKHLLDTDEGPSTVVHEIFVKDRIRMDAYRRGIAENTEHIRDKIVLNLNCGIGVLAILCARAGAKKVYAVEKGPITKTTRSIVEENNLSGTIVVLDSQVEDVELNEKVDVIISDWMGHMLLSESLLLSLMTARDRWLKPGGIILPSKATLYMAPFTDAERYRERIDFWRNVDGIDMSSMIPLAKDCLFSDLWVETIRSENILARAQEVVSVLCHSVTKDELKCKSTKYKFMSTQRTTLNGFAFWFDVQFIENDLLLSTAPDAPPTLWKQSLLYLKEPKELRQDQKIDGCVELSLVPLMSMQHLYVDVAYTLDKVRRNADGWHPKHQPPM